MTCIVVGTGSIDDLCPIGNILATAVGSITSHNVLDKRLLPVRVVVSPYVHADIELAESHENEGL